MIALIQRVTRASVSVDQTVIGSIDQGLLVFVGVERGDTQHQSHRLMDRVMGYRVFSNQEGKMDLSLRDIAGGLLLVPQFTLAADTDKGARASFSRAAEPKLGEHLFQTAVKYVRTQCSLVATGQFGAEMQVSLVNDGPVTFWLQSAPSQV